MSAPIAGRRKGVVAPKPVDALDSSVQQESDVPDWLLGGGGRDTSSRVDVSVVIPPPVQENHSLSFLDMLDQDEAPSPAQVHSVPAYLQPTPLVSSRDDKERQSLMDELEAIQLEQQKVTESISNLENGSHSECHEVRLMTAELEEYRQKLKSVEVTREELKAHEANDDRSRAEEDNATIQVAANALSAELTAHKEIALTNLQQAIEAQEQSVKEKRSLLEEMKKRVAHVDHKEASAALESQLITLLRSLRADFTLGARVHLSKVVQEHCSKAQMQRLEVLSEAARRRWENFMEFRTEQHKARAEFQQTQREKRQWKIDSLAGTLKNAWQKGQEVREQRLREQRNLFFSEIHTIATHQEEFLLKAIASHRAETRQRLTALDSQYAAEERTFRESREREVAFLQHRIGCEAKALRSTLQLRTSAIPEEKRWRIGNLSLLEATRTRLQQAQKSVLMEAALLSAQSSQPSSSLEEAALKEKERDFSRSLETVRCSTDQAWEVMNRQMQDSMQAIERNVAAASQRVGDGRYRVSCLKEGISFLREEWEREVLSQLSRAGRRDSPDMPVTDHILTKLLQSTEEQVLRTLHQQREVRRTRQAFTQAIGTEVGLMERSLSSVDRKTQAVLEQYEALRSVECAAASHQGLLEAAEEELAKAMKSIEKDESKLLVLQQKLEADQRAAYESQCGQHSARWEQLEVQSSTSSSLVVKEKRTRKTAPQSSHSSCAPQDKQQRYNSIRKAAPLQDSYYYKVRDEAAGTGEGQTPASADAAVSSSNDRQPQPQGSDDRGTQEVWHVAGLPQLSPFLCSTPAAPAASGRRVEEESGIKAAAISTPPVEHRRDSQGRVSPLSNQQAPVVTVIETGGERRLSHSFMATHNSSYLGSLHSAPNVESTCFGKSLTTPSTSSFVPSEGP